MIIQKNMSVGTVQSLSTVDLNFPNYLHCIYLGFELFDFVNIISFIIFFDKADTIISFFITETSVGSVLCLNTVD